MRTSGLKACSPLRSVIVAFSHFCVQSQFINQRDDTATLDGKFRFMAT